MKSVYALANACTAAAMVVLITEYADFLGNSLPNYYTSSDVTLADNLKYVLTGCTYTGEIHLMNARYNLSVGEENIVLGLMQCAQYITALFSLLFVTIIINGISLSLYRAGDRHIRVFGIHVPIYHGMVVMSYFINFVTIGTTFSFDSQRIFFRDAVDYCSSVARSADLNAFLSSEFTGYTILKTAVYWPLAAACANLLIFLTAFAVRSFHSYHKADILLSEADAPWEKRGFSCSTSKPLLRLHTTQRNAIVEEANAAMKEGMKVRIVRSYQLLTDEDYEDLVLAMQQQVDETIRDEQFELLRQNFGEDETAWSQSGFMWRDSLPWAVPTPLDSAEEREEAEEHTSTFDDGRGAWSPSGDGLVYERPDGDDEFVDDEEEMLESEGSQRRMVRRRRGRRSRVALSDAEPLALEGEWEEGGEGEEFAEQFEESNRSGVRVRRRVRRRRAYDEGEADELSPSDLL